MENSGLAKEDIDKINTVFSNNQQVERVVLYGSRAKGNFKLASDIDLTLIGRDISFVLLQQIERDLDDLMLPWKMDVPLFEDLSNPDLKEHIIRVGKELYRREDVQNDFKNSISFLKSD
jgi:predicted nucleotidyltransferase